MNHTRAPKFVNVLIRIFAIYIVQMLYTLARLCAAGLNPRDRQAARNTRLSIEC